MPANRSSNPKTPLRATSEHPRKAPICSDSFFIFATTRTSYILDSKIQEKHEPSANDIRGGTTTVSTKLQWSALHFQSSLIISHYKPVSGHDNDCRGQVNY